MSDDIRRDIKVGEVKEAYNKVYRLAYGTKGYRVSNKYDSTKVWDRVIALSDRYDVSYYDWILVCFSNPLSSQNGGPFPNMLGTENAEKYFLDFKKQFSDTSIKGVNKHKHVGDILKIIDSRYKTLGKAEYLDVLNDPQEDIPAWVRVVLSRGEGVDTQFLIEALCSLECDPLLRQSLVDLNLWIFFECLGK